MGKRRRFVSKTPIKLYQLRKSFEVYNQTTGKSPKTIHWYNQKLELFERFLGEEPCLADFHIGSVRAFIADLQNRQVRHQRNPYLKEQIGPLSSSYISGFARGLRAFSTWLYEEGYTETNILKPLKPPRIQRKVVHVLSDDEVARLLARFDQNDSFGCRDYAIVWTLLDTGLRASELCGLTVENAHIEQGYLKVLGKGNKERLVPVGAKTRTVLLRWRDAFRPNFVSAELPTLFVSSSGGALTPAGLHLIIKRAGRAVGIPRLHSHLLRHTFATTYLVKEVGDPLRLQQILGHTSLEMVRHYVALASVESSLQHARTSPMDLFADAQPGSPHARKVQPRRRQRRLTLVR
jgi:site-specific recombinase XerD